MHVKPQIYKNRGKNCCTRATSLLNSICLYYTFFPALFDSISHSLPWLWQWVFFLLLWLFLLSLLGFAYLCPAVKCYYFLGFCLLFPAHSLHSQIDFYVFCGFLMVYNGLTWKFVQQEKWCINYIRFSMRV